jgi:thiol-disulfide isomerase/thioredoxin
MKIADAFLTAGAILLAAPLYAQDGGIALGAKPPEAVVKALDGSSVHMSKLVGPQPTVIEFWATWCPNCKELEPTLNAAQAKYSGKVRFLTVAVAINESFERVQKTVAAHHMQGTVVYDANGNAAGAYDAPATSYVVVVDHTGKVVYTGVGGTQDIDAAIKKAL